MWNRWYVNTTLNNSLLLSFIAVLVGLVAYDLSIRRGWSRESSKIVFAYIYSTTVPVMIWFGQIEYFYVYSRISIVLFWGLQFAFCVLTHDQISENRIDKITSSRPFEYLRRVSDHWIIESYWGMENER